MKKLGIALCLSSTLFAAAAVQAGGWETNFLLGISGGYAGTDGKLNYTMTSPAGVGTAFTRNLSDSGFMWGLLGGYQGRCNGWLLGGELNVDWWDHSGDKNLAFTDGTGAGWSGTTSFKRETNVGLTGRLGYEVASYFMPYLRAGVETSRDKLSFNASNSAQTLTLGGENGRRAYRFVGGIGAEIPVPVVMGLSFRVEYDYHSRGRAVGVSGVASDNATGFSASTKQHANSGRASLVWNFL